VTPGPEQLTLDGALAAAPPAAPTTPPRTGAQDATSSHPTIDVHDGRRPRATPAALRPFVDAGVLTASDVHVATTLTRVADDDRDEVLLAAALAARAPRRQHVCVDLGRVATTVVADGDDLGPTDAGSLPWPDPSSWRRSLAGSPLVAEHDPTTLTVPDGRWSDIAPLTLAGDRLYLDRYWRYERRVAAALAERSNAPAIAVDLDTARTGLDRLFGTDQVPDRQRLAAALALTRRLAVIAGGPGTGKTTTVARVLALLDEQASLAGATPLRIALAAPTGKAAQRLTESLRDAATHLDTDVAIRDRLRDGEATTLHRLLGWHPAHRTRFRHDRHDPLPHDVVVVDETSMVSLALVAKLLDAMRPSARLVLLGDPEQLASVEAGSVLGDLVGPAVTAPRFAPPVADGLGAVVGTAHLSGIGRAAEPGIHDAIVVLDRVHRFGGDSGIAALARAIQHGDADTALAVLRDADDLTWVETDAPPDRAAAELAPVRDVVVPHARSVVEAALRDDGEEALARLDDVRVLCAHRRGPHGVATWITAVERWLATELPGIGLAHRFYPGRPVLVTVNDHRLRVANGDVGVVVRDADGTATVVLPALDGTGRVRRLAPTRLPALETVHAMTIHKSQGSQFGHVVVVLPDPGSPILARELLYTAVTRGRERATVVGTEEAIRAAIARPVQRASGLRAALWPT
jgi:exodeoxyribonuclease V alpha subunit